MLPLISIIVPIYNSENTIQRCIISLINQTYKALEIILIDDGSSDASGQICDSYSIIDKRIKTYHKKNEGVSVARNLGISKAQGEFLLFVDSDDYLSLNACETLMQTQLSLDCDCIIFGFNQLSGTIWAPCNYKQYSSLKDFNKEYCYWLNTELLSSSVNKLYKRSKLKDAFPPDMSFGEDLVFSLSYLSTCEKIVFITDTLYQHDNMNESSISHSFDITRFRDIEKIQQCILKFADAKDDIELYSKYVRDSVRVVRMCLRDNQITFIKKKQLLYDWLSQSNFQLLNMRDYSMDWRNRLMMFFFKSRMLFVSYMVVNGKRILKGLIR